MNYREMGFTGTQVGQTLEQKHSVRALFLLHGVQTLHHGCCYGADEDAHAIACELGMRTVGHPPLNTSKMADVSCDECRVPDDYLVRNRNIVCESSALIACPKEETGEELRSGTWATVRYARQLKRPIYIVRPSGRVQSELPQAAVGCPCGKGAACVCPEM